MSQKINPREVLSYLNELGYVNITAQQLKEFIKDLKKLIKYESRHEETPTKSSVRNFSVDNCQNNDDIPEYYERKVPEYDVFHALHAHNTVASKTRTEGKRGKQISVHITKAKNFNKLHDHCVHVEHNILEEKENHVEPATSEYERTSPELSKDVAAIKVSESEVSNIKNPRPNSKESIGSSAPTKPKKLKSSVIKVGSTKSINRCDPVALYHQYKEEWKKIKFPGQDHHSDLRWAVREKLLSGPPVQVPLRKSSSKRKI